MNHDNHSCMITGLFSESVKHIQSIVDMLPRKAVPVLSFRNDRAISAVSIEHKTTTIHRTTTGSKYKMQWSNRNIPYSNVFKTCSVEYVLNTSEYAAALSWSAARVLYIKIRNNDNIYRHSPDPIKPRRSAAEISEKGMGTRASQEPIPSQSRD